MLGVLIKFKSFFTLYLIMGENYLPIDCQKRGNVTWINYIHYRFTPDAFDTDRCTNCDYPRYRSLIELHEKRKDKPLREMRFRVDFWVFQFYPPEIHS